MERTSKSLQALLEEQGASLAAVQQRLAQSEDAEQGCRRRLTEVSQQARFYICRGSPKNLISPCWLQGVLRHSLSVEKFLL